ncbi:Plasminogen [Lamellibrachia satsuma]|nr:Plasminogen [Lamellibrachia satsuma]
MPRNTQRLGLQRAPKRNRIRQDMPGMGVPSGRSNYCTNIDSAACRGVKPWCYTTDPEKRWEYCDLDHCEEAKECLETPKGYDYRGYKSQTVSGRTCQAWASKSPHVHACTPEGRSNYCTNIDSAACRGVKPWCYTTDPEKRWEYCDLDHCEEAKECLETPKGYDYRGYKSQTVSGRTCQAWASQGPHRHYCSPEGRNNYCTNIDSVRCRGVKPWCYTTDPEKRWEYCDLDNCEETVRKREPENVDSDEPDEEMDAWKSLFA